MGKIRIAAGLVLALAGGIWIGSAIQTDRGISGWETLNGEMAGRLSASAAPGTPAAAPAGVTEAAGAAAGVIEAAAKAPAAKEPAGSGIRAAAGTGAGDAASPEIAGTAAAGIGAGTTRASAPPSSGIPKDGRINVNTAGLAELTELPGIGEKKAQAILDERAGGGPFRDLADLGRVKGIGPKLLEKLERAVAF
ncbi:ComEA family DNA-binding protein [Paenibacillus glufosinatiresistens]|uniref:ComEA family DNA-binding protein n=1 Tax=Paenibacillus glufosinatiresistens TaxID=3070657 RepID=UPI00286E8C30|nr:ComEA family DNA-binding protein [Paenibacillus sp. YX.27]